MDRMTKLLSAVFLSCAALLSACGGGGSDNDRPSSNANLTSLLVENATLNPAFASSTTDYTADVTGGTTETRVTAITTDRGARLTINGDAVVSGTASDPISLIVGVTNVDVVVTAEDGTQRTYSVAIVRPSPSTEARLAELELSAGPLLQPFDPDQFSYDADLGYLATTTRAIADPLDPLASSLIVEGEETVFGAPSDFVPLAVGVDATTLEVTVTAEVEEDCLFLALFLSFLGFGNHLSQGMGSFRSGHRAFRPGPLYAGFISSYLAYCSWCCQPFHHQLTHYGSHTVVTQSASMNGRWNKVVSETVHGQERCITGLIAVIVGK